MEIKYKALISVTSVYMLSIISDKLGIALITPDYKHAQELASIANSQDIADNVGSVGEFPYPYTEKDAVDAISSAISSYELGIGYNFEVIPKSVNSPVGMVGVRSINKYASSCEIGFWIGEKYRRAGYASSSLSLLLAFCFTKLNLNRVYATALKRNEKSIRLMGSLGMRIEGTLREAAITRNGPEDEVLLATLKKDFKYNYDVKITE